MGWHVGPAFDVRGPLMPAEILGRGFLGVALALATAHDAAARQRPLGLGHDRALPLDLVIRAEVDDDPVSRAAELVRARRIREERGEVPGAAFGVKDR